MRRAFAFTCGLIVPACVIALSLIPATAPEPGVNPRVAERDAIRVLHGLERTCPGGRAEAWAEVNSSMPKGYEVIGQCN